jgi:hypothetical protein
VWIIIIVVVIIIIPRDYASCIHFYLFVSALAVREKHIYLMNAHVCVCWYIYTDIIFRENTVQAANVFSVPNAGYFRRNCEFHVLLLESDLGRENWIRLFLKI